jgi:hypothetical protein
MVRLIDLFVQSLIGQLVGALIFFFGDPLDYNGFKIVHTGQQLV